MGCHPDPKAFPEACVPVFLLPPAPGVPHWVLQGSRGCWQGWRGGCCTWLICFSWLCWGVLPPACPQGTVPRCLLMPRGHPRVHSSGALGRGLSPRGASRRWWFSLGCTLTCPFLPQASACWPRAMRCSLKRSLTALLAASFLLLLLILYGGSRQEQDPLQVSPPPVMSCWRGHWSILHPCLPHKNPNPSSAPFPAPYHPQSPALPSPPPGLPCAPGPPQSRSWEGRTGAPTHFWVPLAHACPWYSGV